MLQVSLARGIAGGQIGALGTASRVGFVAGQSIAQVGSLTGGTASLLHVLHARLHGSSSSTGCSRPAGSSLGASGLQPAATPASLFCSQLAAGAACRQRHGGLYC
jgi:hypothetical protein